MRILIVTPYLPHASIGHGGGTAIRGLIAGLARRHEVGVASLLRPGEDTLTGSVRDLGVSLTTVPFVDTGASGRARLGLWAARSRALGRALTTGYPYYVAKYENTALVAATQDAMRAFRPDVVQVEYLQLAGLLRALRRWRDARSPGSPKPRLVLDSHELGSLPRRRRAAGAPWPLRLWFRRQAAAWDRLARDASLWADATLCVTEQDRRLFAEIGGRNLVTVPLGIDTHNLACERDPDPAPRLLFVGSFQHPPNRSTARLLCDRIWPQVAPLLPGWELVLAGPGSDTFLASRPQASPGIRATGYVDDLTPLFRSSRLFVAPLVEGGGIKIKILEAMARGIPIVTTPIGAEGIAGESEELVWWADSADAFASVLLAAAGDPEGAARRAVQARSHVEARFSWQAVVGRLEDVYGGEQPAAGD